MWSLLESALRIARREAEEAEAYGERRLQLSLLAERGRRVRSEFFKQRAVALRVRRRGRWGFAYATDPDPEDGARDLVRRALAGARLAPRPAAALRLPGRRRCAPVPGTFDPALARLDVSALEERLERIHRGGEPVARSIRFSEGRIAAAVSETFLANSRGAEVSERATHLTASVTALAGATSGDEYATARRERDVDWEGLGRRAAESAWASRKPERLPPGTWNLLLAPRALAELLEHTTATHLSGEALRQGATPYRPGLRAMAPGFGLVDDGRLPGGWSSGRADGEGVPKRRTPLIRDGRVAGFLYDLSSGARAGRPSTGNGLRSFRSVPGVAPTNFVFEGVRRRTAEMRRERALLVTDLIGAHTARRASGEFSVAVHRGFRMGDGAPVKGAMLAGSSVELLRRIDALGDDDETRGFLAAPTVRVRGWRVTG